MGRKLVNTKETSHEQWLEIRKKSIGGSEAGALIGLSPYASPLTVYLDKKGMSKHKETNEAMRQGTDFEQYVAERFTEETGKKVKRDNFMYMHDDYDFITANIDRVVVGENAGLECKTMGAFNDYDLEGGEYPQMYYTQCQHYMMVKGFDKMYLAILVFQRGFYVFEIERDENFIQDLLIAEKTFWEEYIMKDVMPQPDGSEASEKAVREMFPEGNEDKKTKSPDTLVELYIQYGERVKMWKDKQTEVKNKICMLMGDAVIAESDKYKCSWKNQSISRLDTKALKEQMPTIYNKFLKKSESRVFRVKEA